MVWPGVVATSCHSVPLMFALTSANWLPTGAGTPLYPLLQISIAVSVVDQGGTCAAG